MVGIRTTWQLQEAKNKFSELVRRATDEGPQFVAVHGKETAVMASVEDYNKMQPEEHLGDILMNSPLRGSGVVFERDNDWGREVDLG